MKFTNGRKRKKKKKKQLDAYHEERMYHRDVIYEAS